AGLVSRSAKTRYRARRSLLLSSGGGCYWPAAFARRCFLGFSSRSPSVTLVTYGTGPALGDFWFCLMMAGAGRIEGLLYFAFSLAIGLFQATCSCGMRQLG